MRALISALLIFAISGQNLKSQNYQTGDTASLGMVVIRSTSLADSLLTVPVDIAVIGLKDLEENSGDVLTPILNRVPGVIMQQGALNTASISIRGIGSRAQYGTNRIKAYLNDIPISSVDGVSVLDDIDPDILESVEIIKGPNSALYGAGLGGSINLYTKTKKERVIQLRSILGSFGLTNNSLRLATYSDKLNLNLSFNGLQSNGFRQNSEYSRRSLTFNTDYSIDAKSNLNFFARYVDLDAEIPSSLNQTDFEENPDAAAENWLAAQGYEAYQSLLAGISYSRRLAAHFSGRISLFGSIRDGYEPRPFDILDADSRSVGFRSHWNLDYRLGEVSAELAFGAEYQYGQNENRRFENLYTHYPNQGSVAGNEIGFLAQDNNYLNLFVQQKLEWEDFQLRGDLNLNHTNYAMEWPAIEHSFGWIAAPRISTAYTINMRQTIYAAIGRGFSTPTFEESLLPDGGLNTGLQAETGVNYELGYKTLWWDGKLLAELILYHMDIENLLIADRIGEDQYIGKNAGSTEHRGLSFNLQGNFSAGEDFRIAPHLSLSLHDYVFDEFTDEGNNFSGNELTGVPDHTLNLGFDLQYRDNLRFFINYFQMGAIPMNDSNTLYSEAYGLLNLKLSYELAISTNIRLKAEFGVNNMTNEAYAARILPNALGFGNSQPRYYYPGAPRNFYGGLSLNWGY